MTNETANDSQASGESAEDMARLRALADSLDCLLDEDLQLLTRTTAATTKGWAGSGNGPAYSLVGNRRLYPRQLVSEWMLARVRERRPVDTKGTL